MKIPKTWTFKNEEVAKNFDNHVREQLPWYDLATKAIIHIARHYIPQEGLVYDLGASTGNIGNSLKDIMKDRDCKFVALEKEKSMIDMYQCDFGEIYEQDIKNYAYNNYDVGICFLTLMFIEPKYRRQLLDTLYDKELSLQGIQRQIDAKLLEPYNPKLFFKFSDFVGYVIEK